MDLARFRGRSTHVLDSKGRLSVPARFRDILKAKYDGKLVVTTTPKCLKAYPFDEWQKLEDRFLSNDLPLPQIEQFQRFFLGGAVECQLDGQGRILIPAPLRKEVGLNKEIVLQGMLHYFEIWDRKKLSEELERVKENFDQYSEMVAKFERGA